ncbi:MAG: hypothetical protein HYT13_01540 [Candidatus Liptonbacteria bacterium]|nr:hypothetical protein [Candidatus Liptonbacteria bacterium]
MTTQSITSVTDGQKKQYLRFVEDAADKALVEAVLDKDGLQRVIENGDDLQAAIVAKLKELSVTNEYADEEVGSNYGYLSGYKPKGIAEQIKTLRKLFPSIGTADEQIASKPLPASAEGWFAIPRYELVAASYNDAVLAVLELTKKDRNGKFYNWCEGHLGPQYLHQTERAVRSLKKIGEEQKGHDILVVAAQFGLRHRGRSVRRARSTMNSSEFGLGAFAVGVILLTHPERLKHYDDLWIDCAGDEYSPDADGRFDEAPLFDFDDGEVEFFTHWVGNAREFYGSASGFLPQ